MKATDVVKCDPKSYTVALDIKEVKVEPQEVSPERVKFGEAHMAFTCSVYDYWEERPETGSAAQVTALTNIYNKLSKVLKTLKDLNLTEPAKE
jgi:hypothetical protein